MANEQYDPRSEAEKIEEGTHIRCSCNNLIEPSSAYCKYCNAVNRAGTNKNCPTCGSPFVDLVEPAPVI